jgi:DNA-binding NtrC family response regulator
MSVCKVLVIDDVQAEAVKIAKQIRDLDQAPALLELELDLEIEISTSASWAWAELENDPSRWDLIISDVMMPKEDLIAPVIRESGDGLLLWRRRGEKEPPGFEHGGFGLLAKGMAEWRLAGPEEPLPKLVLVSAQLARANRREVNAFASEHRPWFQYLDKEECPEHWGNDRKHLYRYALLQALAKHREKNWSGDNFQPVTSEWRALRLAASRMAADWHIRHVLVLGPTGSGKSVLAGFLLSERGFKNPPILNAGMLDKSGLEDRWHRGGLYIDQLERMTPSAHDPVHREMEDTPENPDGENSLCVWSATSIDALKASNALSGSFISLLKAQSLEIGKLGEEDVKENAGAILRQIAPTLSVRDDVYEALAKADWPDNLQGLQIALKEAVRRVTEFGHSELRVEHLPIRRRGSVEEKPPLRQETALPEAVAPLRQDVAQGIHPGVPKMNTELYRQYQLIDQVTPILQDVKKLFTNTDFQRQHRSNDQKLKSLNDKLAGFGLDQGKIETIVLWLEDVDRFPKQIATWLCSGYGDYYDLQVALGLKQKKKNQGLGGGRNLRHTERLGSRGR